MRRVLVPRRRRPLIIALSGLDGAGKSIFVDTGSQRVPGFPMNIGSAGGRWTRRPPSEHAVTGFRAKPFFYEGEVIITAQREGQISALVPLSFGGIEIAFDQQIVIQFRNSGLESPGQQVVARTGVRRRH